MANILQMTFYNVMDEKLSILIQVSLKLVHKGRTHKKLSLAQVMAWHHQTKPLHVPKPMLTKFYDATYSVIRPLS